MIIGAIIFWRDRPELLKKALVSLRKHTDYIIAVDGKFRDYPSDLPDLSDKDLRDLALHYANELIDAPGLSQEEKRNKYLRGKPGDYYIVLDADEELMFGLSPESLKEDDYLLPIVYDDTVKTRWLVYRIFKQRPTLRYYHWHTLLWVDGLPIDHEKIPMHPTLRIKHNSCMRTLERQESDTLFVKNRDYGADWKQIANMWENGKRGGGRMQLRYKGGLGPQYNCSIYHVKQGQVAEFDEETAERVLRQFPASFEQVSDEQIAASLKAPHNPIADSPIDTPQDKREKLAGLQDLKENILVVTAKVKATAKPNSKKEKARKAKAARARAARRRGKK